MGFVKHTNFSFVVHSEPGGFVKHSMGFGREILSSPTFSFFCANGLSYCILTLFTMVG